MLAEEFFMRFVYVRQTPALRDEILEQIKALGQYVEDASRVVKYDATNAAIDCRIPSKKE